MAIFGQFLPPERGQKLGAKIFLQESQTKRPYASNKPSYIKIRPFWARYLQKNGQKPYNVTTCNVFFTQKGPKRDFSRNFHWVIPYIDPK